jgi:N-formylglutamate deformylase
MDMHLPMLAALPASPIKLCAPPRQEVPIVFASPHSGADYPAEFVAAARLDLLGLRRSEDCFVDELFAAAPAHGAPLLAATFPRAFCDANREPWELDPAMFDEALPPWVNSSSPRVGAGLGTIPRIVASGETIYRDKLTFAEAERRVRQCWQPYHDALRDLIDATRTRFGGCLLIDCHSMPSNSAAGRAGGGCIDIVIGDAHGTSCAAGPTRLIERTLYELGYRVRRNDPYSGGYITRHYGRPRERVHAIQVEIARALYMDEERLDRLGRFTKLQRDLTALIAALAVSSAAILRA